MALTRCSECGKEISSRAAACPNCGCPNAKDLLPANTPLDVGDEYKTVHEEIAMCQKEMHQTWLWAAIAAGAIYVWLAAHRSEINSLHEYRWPIWFVPLIPLLFCGFRYLIFNRRITWLAQYLLKIEDAGLGPDHGSPLVGVAHHHQECLNRPFRWKEKDLGSTTTARDGTGARPSAGAALTTARTAPNKGDMYPAAEAAAPEDGRAPVCKCRPAWKTVIDKGQGVLWFSLILISIVVSLYLALAPSEDSLSGRVADSAGHPMSGVTITLDPSHAVTTDNNGCFHGLRR
jgi:hypothetical protein